MSFVSVDLSIGGMWRERIDGQGEKTDEHRSPLSNQQLVRLIRSIILIEKVLRLFHDLIVFGQNVIRWVQTSVN